MTAGAATGGARTPVTWIKARRNDAALAFMVALVFGVLYFALNGESDVSAFIREVAPNVVVGSAAYLLVNYILFKDELDNSRTFLDRLTERIAALVGSNHGVRDVWPEPLDDRWRTLLASAASVSMFIRYADEWASRYHEELVALFRRGGRLTVYLPVADDDRSLNVMAEDREVSTPRELHQVVDELKLRIERTKARLAEAREEADRHEREAGGSGCPGERLAIHSVPRPLSHWAIRMDERVAVVAPYEHWPASGRRAPVIVFDLSANVTCAKWLRQEFRHLADDARQDGKAVPAA